MKKIKSLTLLTIGLALASCTEETNIIPYSGTPTATLGTTTVTTTDTNGSNGDVVDNLGDGSGETTTDAEGVITFANDNLKGEINDGETATLDGDYVLRGVLRVKSGGVLNIESATRILAVSSGTNAGTYVVVDAGGTLNVNGTADNPVVMTSGSNTPAAGDWGGLVICGNAPTNKGAQSNILSEVGNCFYGGAVSNDNSGSITYLRVEYTGASTGSSETEFNGITLFGVGSGTTFEYVESYEGSDDGIEFFGGTVNGKYLVSVNSGDDSMDFADGWSGTGQYWYIKGGAKAGIEGSNNGDDGDAAPVTNATVSNVSIVGEGSEGALYVKEGGGRWDLNNIYVDGHTTLGVKIKSGDAPANRRVANDSINIVNIEFANGTPAEKTQYATDTDLITEGDANGGAGNDAGVPSWAASWGRF